MSERDLALKWFAEKATGIALSRRRFVQLTAGVPVALGSVSLAQEADYPVEDELRINLSEDREVLTISLFRGGDDKPALWELHRRKFGPDAFFRIGHLQRKPKESTIIKVENASLGERSGKFVQLIFQRKDAVSKGGWAFSLSTNIWPSSENDQTSDFENPAWVGGVKQTAVDLFTFLKETDGERAPSLILSPKLVDVALNSASDSRLRVEPGAWKANPLSGRRDPVFSVRFMKDQTWRVEPIRDKLIGFVALSGAVRGDGVLIAEWSHRSDEGQKSTSLFHSFAVKLRARDDAALLEFEGPTRETATLSNHSDAALPLRVLYRSTSDEVEKQQLIPSIAFVTVERAGIRTSTGLGTSAEPLKLEKVVVSELRADIAEDSTAKKFAIRTVVTGSVASDGKAADPLHQEIETPVGRLTVTNQPTKPRDDTAASAGLDELLVSAEGKRPFNPIDDVWIMADGAARNSSSRKLKEIDIQLVLLAADTALPDAHFSRLSFGLPNKTEQVNGSPDQPEKTDGERPRQRNGADLILCMDQDAARPPYRGPGNGSFVGLFNGSSPVKARFDLTRSTLDVSHGDTMVALGFTFADLFLEFREKPSLVPASQECRLISNRDGTLVDNRPRLVVHLKPQHLMEEAVVRPLFEIEKKVIGNRIKQMIAKVTEAMTHAASESSDAARAALLENAAESNDILYGFFRDFYVQSVAELNRKKACRGHLPAQFFNVLNRRHLPAESIKALSNVDDALEKGFSKWLDPDLVSYPEKTRARAARGSRLAFRINCGPTSEDTGNLEELDFTLASLTRLERHEPEVATRARAFIEPLTDGRVPLAASGAATLDRRRLLALNGIEPHAKNALVRMDQVRAALAEPPSDLETSIELPARLHLSTSERAIWIANWHPPDGIYEKSGAATEGKTSINRVGEVSETRHRLWTVRLVTDLSTPDVRVVWTPDYRPEPLRPWPKGERDPMFAAPPYGLEAPWKQKRSSGETQPEQDEVCEPSVTKRITDILSRTVSPLAREAARERKREETFLTELSANDRHQLYQLTSARGLPTIGKREFDGENLLGGALVKGSHQFEPGEDYRLADLNDDQAIYDPQPLQVQELSLSSLGGSLVQTTAFNPPLAARMKKDAAGVPAHLKDRPVFDSLSLQLYQHHIVLGRIVIARLSYKGYLFPLGHRASLVKLTERLIVQTANGGFVFIPVQLYFITVSEPTKRFPAVGQPNRGRRFGVNTVRVNADTNIDLQDPSFLDLKGDRTQRNGRINLGPIGMVFWPVNRDTQDRIRFEIEIDGARTTAPLIFVDNTAIGDPDVLGRLSAYYNAADDGDTANPLDNFTSRTWQLGGAKISMAEQRKSGDTKVSTESVTIAAEGLASENSLKRWEGTNASFGTYGALEGADQPPFYPVIEQASINLDSVTEFSGSDLGPIDACYDGHFVRWGFAIEGGDNDAQDRQKEAQKHAQENGLEIFLNFKAKKMEMEANGDRSGGVARPSNPIIGLSRKNGLVSNNSLVPPYAKFGSTNEDKDVPKAPTGAIDNVKLLESIVPFFVPPATENSSLETRELIRRSQVDFLQSIRHVDSSAVALNEITGSTPKEDKIKAQAKLNFDGNAKILGCLTFDQLFELLALAGLDLSAVLPKLLEAVSYGLEILNQVEEYVDDVLEAVRSSVLRPVAAILERLEKSWDELNKRIEEAQTKAVTKAETKTRNAFGNDGNPKAGAKFQPLLLSQLFPEISEGLGGLRTALDKAIAESDPLEMPEALATVYEAGDGLVKGLSAVASDPVERLEQGLREVFDENVNSLERAIKGGLNDSGITTIIGLLENEDALEDKLIDFAIDQILKALPPELFNRLALLPIVNLPSLPEVKAHLESLAEAERAAFLNDIEGVRKTLSNIIPEVKKDVLDTALEHLKKGEVVKAREEIADALKSLKKQSLKAVGEAKTKLGDTPRLKPVEKTLTSALGAYETALKNIDGDFSDYGKSVNDFTKRLDRIIDAALAEVERIKGIVDTGKSLVEAAKGADFDGFLAALSSLSVTILGVDYLQGSDFFSFVRTVEDTIDLIDDLYKRPIKRLLDLSENQPTVTISESDKEICAASEADRIMKLIAAEQDPSFFRDLLEPVKKAVEAIDKAAEATKHFADALEDDDSGVGRDAKPKVWAILGEVSAANDDANPTKVLPFLRLQRQRLADLYCLNIEAAEILNQGYTEVRAQSLSTVNLKASLEKLAKAQEKLLKEAGDLVTQISKDTAQFAKDRKDFLTKTVDVLKSLAEREVQGQIQVVHQDLLYWLKNAGEELANDLKRELKEVENRLTRALLRALNALIGTLNGVTAVLQPLTKLPVSALEPALTALPNIILTDEEASQFVTKLKRLNEALNESLQVEPFILTSPTDEKLTFNTLLAATQGVNGTTLGSVLDDPEQLLQRPAQILDEGRDAVEGLLQRLTTRGKGLEGVALERLDPHARELLIGTLDSGQFPADYDVVEGGLVGLYKDIATPRDALVTQLENQARWLAGTVSMVLRPDVVDGDDLLVREAKKLFDKSETPLSNKEARDFYNDYLRSWDSGEAAPLKIIQGVEELVGQVTKGDIFALIDVSALRDELEDQLSALIPLKRKVGYTFEHKFGSETPKDALFYPLPDSRFDLSFKAEVNLLDVKDFKYEADGALGPFRVNLLHSFGIEAIQLNFGGATFRMAAGEKFQFDVDFQDYEIGPALEFVAELKAYLGVQGSGLFVDPLKNKPGVLAGYGLDLGIISLGALSFSNVSLAISAELPFDDSTALFRASLSRRLAPFMISALPWAGSGFFGVIATANAIVGFEAAMEFGVGGAFQIGPLVGYGRIQAGFYIKTIKLPANGNLPARRVTSISGTFYAGGTGSIWIFSISASLYVRLGMLDDGSMFGEAVFTFSFKIGFAKFRFSVRAAYGQEALGSGEKAASNESGESEGGLDRGRYEILPPTRKAKAQKPIQFAALGNANTITDVYPFSSELLEAAAPEDRQASSDGVGMQESWSGYRAYFDEALL